MTLIIKKPTGAKLVMRQTWQPMDPDAAAYITAVEAADTAAGSPGGLEERTKIAIDNFVLGCKADGIWNAIKASCILAGARTLNGALVPLVGTAPTNVNFVSDDYNRKTGLIGDGSTKYLNSNRNNNADPQNSFHLSVFPVTVGSTNQKSEIGSQWQTGASGTFYSDASTIRIRARAQASGAGESLSGSAQNSKLLGISRSSSTTVARRFNGTTDTVSSTSQPPGSSSIHVFNENGGNFYSSSRLAFYSIGESLDLALLDARVTDLINAFGAAIP